MSFYDAYRHRFHTSIRARIERGAHKGVELWDYFTPTKDNFYSFIFVLPSHLNKY